MSIHYKFKSNLDHDTVTFDGLNISVADLKKSIMQQKKIGKSSDFDLQITNAQTKEVYDNDEILVPKNTSVIVARVPVQGGNKKNWDKPDLPLPLDDDDLGHIRYDRIVKNADLVNANTSEEDKVKAMITQSSQEYDPSKYVKSRSMTGPLPPTYTCYRCGKQGHWIKNCPTNNPDVKRSTGIPRSFMIPVDGPEHKGALLTSSGDYAVPLIDHQAYKEVKKEKPPFVPQEDPVAEPEAEVPGELLCMFCKDLLQDAVLIPCCGNSFCDECIRQILLESDNHECPVCHEIGVSPNTLIPNRFLRTAVLNYKNETGYTRIKRATCMKSPPAEIVESPQPSPDSTVENQSHGNDNYAGQIDQSPQTTDNNNDISDVKKENENTAQGNHTPENLTPKGNFEEDSDARPGTPLADELPNDGIHLSLPIQTIGQEHFNTDRYNYESSSKSSRNYHDDYRYRDDLHEPHSISTIETITNMRKSKYGRPAPVRQQFLDQRSHRDAGRSNSYYRNRDDYYSRYDKRNSNDKRSHKTSHSPHYERSSRDSRYATSPASEYSLECDNDYDVPPHSEESIHRHQGRYRSPPHPVLIPTVPTAIFPTSVPSIPPPHPALIPTPEVFAPQPPPPGASPINISAVASQPPPPGVGPLLPVSDSAFGVHPLHNKDLLKQVSKYNERSIDDRMEEFQRKLEKCRRYSRGRRSFSPERHRSRSSSYSRSYSSKSWTRSPARSASRTSRSRSHSLFSSRSRSRSHSRSGSWSKKRSYTRSRSRSRTKSRSQSRSRGGSSLRRRGHDLRDRQRSPVSRARSRSFSPKTYRMSSHRNLSYSGKHNYTPPQYTTGASYQSQYVPPPAILPVPIMRPPSFPLHHLHSIPPAIQTLHTRPVQQYPGERPPYGDQYSVYDEYQPKYSHHYERDQRIGEHRDMKYQQRSEYNHQEEVPHRIPGWVSDGSRDYKPRYRQSRDIQRKEIKELPKVSESDLRAVHTRESSVEAPKKKEGKATVKHKKHHHHHKSKEVRKQDNKIPVVVSGEKHSDSSKKLTDIEIRETEKEDDCSIPDSKGMATVGKTRDKKHKHKRHKIAELPVKKKKTIKKEKTDGASSPDSDLPSKIKVKKKSKPKVINEDKITELTSKEKEPSPSICEAEPNVSNSVESEELPVEDIKAKPVDDPDVLDIFVDDPEVGDFDTELIGEDFDTELIGEEKSTELDDAMYGNAESIKTENIEVSESSEDAEESHEKENVLHVDVPGISKWERDESEDEENVLPQHRSSAEISKEEKGSISSDIICRAENVLLTKQFKPRVDKKQGNSSKVSSDNSSIDSSPSKRKEGFELKSVVNSQQLKSDFIQITISNNKDKRLVYSSKDRIKNPKSDSISKQERHERSIRYHDKGNLHRSVAVHSARSGDHSREHRDRIPDRGELRYSPEREAATSSRNSSRDGRDYIRKDTVIRDEKKRKYDDYYSSSYSRTGSRDRSDRRMPLVEPVTSHSRSKLSYEKEISHLSEKQKQEKRRKSSSKSVDSAVNHHSHKKRRNRNESAEEYHSIRSKEGKEEPPRKKHSPIKAPDTSSGTAKFVGRVYHHIDELKFEPDYDEFSDEEKSCERSKRKASSPEVSCNVSKIERTVKIDSDIKGHKIDTSSVIGRVSSSAVSESDSSNSDDQKGTKSKSSDAAHKHKDKKSKHKKHKKHKKHRKKKSHRKE